MKDIMMMLAAAVLICGIAIAQQPAGKGSQKVTKSEMKRMKGDKKAKLSKFTGTVDAVDAAAGKVTVKDKKGMTMVMPVGADAKIMKAGKAAALSDIKAGDRVHIIYEGDMGRPVVKELTIKDSKFMKKEKTKKSMSPKS